MGFSFLSIFYLFDFFLLADRFYFYLFFLSFFYRFLVFSVLVECGISRARFFWVFLFSKMSKMSKKSKKTSKKGSKKKGRSWTFLYHPRKTRKIVFFDLLIAPLAGTFQKPDPLPRSCFYTVLVLVVGGVQSGDNFFRLFFQGPSCRRQICAIDFRR